MYLLVHYNSLKTIEIYLKSQLCMGLKFIGDFKIFLIYEIKVGIMTFLVLVSVKHHACSEIFKVFDVTVNIDLNHLVFNLPMS